MKPRRKAAISWGGLVTLGAVGLLVFVTTAVDLPHSQPADLGQPTEAAKPDASPPLFPTTINGPGKLVGIPTGEVDRLGNPVLANCTTCHATRPANTATRDGKQLKECHAGLVTSHGQLQCVACHNPGNYSQLRLASGDAIEFSDSMKLCSQCHGPQYRDYLNGAHGGMTGYWDLSRGPRTRNHCLVCHDAHAPQYQQVMPVFGPRTEHSQGEK